MHILLQQKPLPVDEIKSILRVHHQQLFSLASISGSFKTIYALNREFAVATTKGSTSRQMLSKEKKLLEILEEANLPVVKLYSDVFELQQDYEAVLLQWIPDAILIDVKDFESAQRKLMIAALGIDLPVSGEAWVLYKNIIELRIKQMFANSSELYVQVQEFAKNLHRVLLDIINNLESNALRIADLQLLVTKEGEVSIIDPIDVVKIKSSMVNSNVYLSLLDESIQDDPGFVQQLMMGQDMLNNCLRWCSEIMKLSSNIDMLQYFIAPSKQVVETLDIRKSILKKGLSKQGFRQSLLVSDAQEESSPKLSVLRKATMRQSKSVLTEIQAVSHLAKPLPLKGTLPPTSSTKKENHVPNTQGIKLLSAQKEEQTSSSEDLFESSYKAVTFQFQQVKIASPVCPSRRSTFNSSQPPASSFHSSENDGTRINSKVI